MPFALRYKETGELWTGANIKAPKYYSSAGVARQAISGILSQSRYGTRHVLGMDYDEYNTLCHEGLDDLKKAMKDAEEQYRRVQYDHKNDATMREMARDRYSEARHAFDAALTKNRKRIRDEYSLLEVVEV